MGQLHVIKLLTQAQIEAFTPKFKIEKYGY